MAVLVGRLNHPRLLAQKLIAYIDATHEPSAKVVGSLSPTRSKSNLVVRTAHAKASLLFGQRTQSKPTHFSTGYGEEEHVHLEQSVGDDGVLVFEEFVRMITSHWLPLEGNLTERCRRIRTLREAFDHSDVDGDGFVEFDELETIVLSLE